MFEVVRYCSHKRSEIKGGRDGFKDGLLTLLWCDLLGHCTQSCPSFIVRHKIPWIWFAIQHRELVLPKNRFMLPIHVLWFCKRRVLQGHDKGCKSTFYIKHPVTRAVLDLANQSDIFTWRSHRDRQMWSSDLWKTSGFGVYGLFRPLGFHSCPPPSLLEQHRTQKFGNTRQQIRRCSEVVLVLLGNTLSWQIADWAEIFCLSYRPCWLSLWGRKLEIRQYKFVQKTSLGFCIKWQSEPWMTVVYNTHQNEAQKHQMPSWLRLRDWLQRCARISSVSYSPLDLMRTGNRLWFWGIIISHK